MYAITVRDGADPKLPDLVWAETPTPGPGPGEVLIEVTATAINRADLLQRRGFYPPPPGTSEIIGLECSGTIAEVGEGVTTWSVGDRVCALLAGGGYAEYVAVPVGQVMPVPDGVDLVDAAGLPEVAATVWSNVFTAARLTAGETLLVHGGAGGIGTHAVQVAAARGARVAVTAGSDEKLALCAELGAEILVNYRTEDFVEKVKAATDGRGADVVLDNMGAKYLARNLDVLGPDGRLAVIGFQGGTTAELNMGAMLGKRLQLTAIGLRGRPVDGPGGKAEIIAAVVDQVWPLLASGRVRPVVHARLPIAEAGRGHALLDSGEVAGKVVLQVR